MKSRALTILLLVFVSFLSRLEAKSYNDWLVDLRAVDSLADDQINGFSSILRGGNIDGLNENQTYAVKDEILNSFERQETLPTGSIELLCDIATNPKQDDVMRDYAIQHLSTMYPRATDKLQVEKVLWKSLNESNKSIAGTTLIALQRIFKDQPGRLQEIRPHILKLLKNVNANVESRVAAIQLAGEWNMKECESYLIELSQTSNSIPMRLSAIGSLGQIGGSSSIANLEKMLFSKEKPLSVAATKALKRIKARNS